jgi:hypothetical protein
LDAAPSLAEKVPAAHAEHAAAPIALENEPAGHGRHADASDAPCSALYEPAPQGTHAPLLRAPTASPHVPAGHGIAIPVGQKKPAAQGWHTAAPEIAINVPGAQVMQLALLIEPRFGFDEPMAHARHADDDAPPGASLYVPAGHRVHAAAAAGEKAPAGPAWHAPARRLPARELYVPAAHAAHAARPIVLPNVPGTHE